MNAPQAKTGAEVERMIAELRKAAEEIAACHMAGWGNTCLSAAEFIASLAAERAEVERLMGDLRSSDEHRLELQRANLLLAKELDKMRAQLSDEKTAFYAGYGAAHDDINNSRAPVIQIAWDRRAALSPSQQGEPK